MKKLLIAAAIFGWCTDAMAISQMNASSMSCDAIQAGLESQREAIIRYPSSISGVLLFDRYVSKFGQCNVGYLPTFSPVPSRDTRSCVVNVCARVQHGHH